MLLVLTCLSPVLVCWFVIIWGSCAGMEQPWLLQGLRQAFVWRRITGLLLSESVRLQH